MWNSGSTQIGLVLAGLRRCAAGRPRACTSSRRRRGWRASASRPWACRWCRRCTAAARCPRHPPWAIAEAACWRRRRGACRSARRARRRQSAWWGSPRARMPYRRRRSRWSTRPSALNFCAISAMKPMLVVTRMRAPESCSLKASSRSASSGERCTTRAPHLQRGEEADRVIGRVGQVERDRLAGSGAKLHQPRGDRLDRLAQLGVAGLAVAILERRLVRPLR